MLKCLHIRHFGIESFVKRAQKSVFWHGMSDDIVEFNKSFSVSDRTQNSPPKKLLINKKVPELPWHIVAVHLLNFHKKDYLLTSKNFDQQHQPNEKMVFNTWYPRNSRIG